MAPPGSVSPLEEYQLLDSEIRRKVPEEKRRKYMFNKLPSEILKNFNLDALYLKSSSDLLKLAKDYFSEKIMKLSLAERLTMINFKVKVLSRKDGFVYAWKQLLTNTELCGLAEKADILIIKYFIDLIPPHLTKIITLDQPIDVRLEDWLNYASRIDAYKIQTKGLSTNAASRLSFKSEVKEKFQTPLLEERPKQPKLERGANRNSTGLHVINSSANKEVIIEGLHSSAFLDSGADGCYLSKSCFDSLPSAIKRKLNTSNKIPVEFANKKDSLTLGCINLKISIPFGNIVDRKVLFHILEEAKDNYIGLEECCSMKILSRLEEELAVKPREIIMVNESVPFEIRKFLDNNDYLINEDWSKEPVLKISITVSKDYKPLQVKSAPFRQDLKIEAKVILRENIEKNFIKKVDVVTPDLEISKCMMVKQEGKNSSLVLIPKNVNKFIECGKKKIFSLKQLLSNAGNKIFTSLDVKSAYNLIGLNEDSKKFCCFSTEEGVYQAERLQLGFKDAPFHFIEAIEHLLEGIDFTGWFMDDIIIYAPSQIHNEIILKVLGRLASVNFKLSLNKCKFRQISVDFIGYDLKADGAAIPYSKKEKLSNTRSPRTLKEIKSIFSSLSFYRSLIPRYTELTEDFCNKKTFTWKKQDEKNFREILVLIEDKTKLSFIIGGTLSFRLCMSFGKRSFSFAFYYGEALFTLGGRVLNRSEINYSQTSLYALCIKEALFENAWIINAAVIKVEVSDCDIRKLLSHPPKMNEINNHVMRHIIPLECFNIAYVSVSEFNIFNDMRVEILDTKELKQTANKLCAINEQENSYLIDDSVEIKKAYGIDSISKIMLKSIEEPLTQQEILLLPKCIGKQKILLSEKGLLLIGLKKKIWIPEDLEETILEKLHQVHSNDTAMIKLANATIVFKDWTTKIKRKYAHCKRCQLFRRAGRFNFSSWPESTSVLERVHMDHAQIGNKYILLFVDSFSNHLTLKICKNMVTETLCKQFIEYVNEAGIPSLVVSDQYPVFLSASFQKLLEELNCLQMFATPYNSFTNGEVEEYVQFSKSQLAKFTEDGVKLEDAIAKTILENRLTVAKNGRTVIQNYFNDTRSSIEHIFAKYKPDFQEINEKCLYKHKLADQKWLEAVCHYRIGNQAFIVEDNQGKFHLRKPNCISINNTIKGADVSETTKLDEEARTEMFKKVYLLTALTAEQEESKAIESSGC